MGELRAGLIQALDSANAAVAAWQERIDRFPADWQALLRTPEGFRDALAAAEASAGPDPRGEVYAVLDELADAYMTSPQDRDAIRREVGARSALLGVMYEYIGRNSERVRETGRREWLRRGIAMAAIEDLRNDFRDLYGYLGELYFSAEASGLDPHADLIEVGRMASAHRDRRRGSTRDFLTGFEASAAFAEMRRTRT